MFFCRRFNKGERDNKMNLKLFLKKVKRKMRLKDGMHIRFGDVECEFKEQ